MEFNGYSSSSNEEINDFAEEIPKPLTVEGINIVKFPKSVLEKIFKKVSVEDLFNCTLACKFLNKFLGSSDALMSRTILKWHYSLELDSFEPTTRNYQEIHYRGSPNEDNMSAMQFVLINSKESLKCLRLFEFEIKSSDLYVLLRQLPNINMFFAKQMTYKDNLSLTEHQCVELKSLKKLWVMGNSDLRICRHFKKSSLAHLVIQSDYTPPYLMECFSLLKSQPYLKGLYLMICIFQLKHVELYKEWKFNLTSLVVELCKCSKESEQCLREFVVQRGCNLTQLTIQLVTISDSKLFQTILYELPKLSELSLNYNEFLIPKDSLVNVNSTIKKAMISIGTHYDPKVNPLAIFKPTPMNDNAQHFISLLSTVEDLTMKNVLVDIDLFITLEQNLKTLETVDWDNCKFEDSTHLPKLKYMKFKCDHLQTMKLLRSNRQLLKVTLVDGIKKHYEGANLKLMLECLVNLEALDITGVKALTKTSEEFLASSVVFNKSSFELHRN